MAVLDFPKNPTLNQTFTATNNVTYLFDGTVWVAVSGTSGLTGATPVGPAGGDLAGTYPNPQVAPGAIGNAEITDVAWSKITGTPASFPAGGPAGGDLSGTYPNPTVFKSAGTFTANGQLNANGNIVVKPTSGLPSCSFDYSGVSATPAGGQVLGVLNNYVGAPLAGQLYWYATEQWAAGTKEGTGFSLKAVQQGTTTLRERLRFDQSGCIVNGVDGAADVTIDTTGALNAVGATDAIVWGQGTVRGRLNTLPTTAEMTINATRAGVQDDGTKPSWHLALDATSNNVRIAHQLAGATGSTNLFTLDASGNLTIQGKLNGGATYRGTNSAPLPVSYNSGTTNLNTWLPVASVSWTTSGGLVLVNATNISLYLGGDVTKTPTAYIGIARDGAAPGVWRRLNSVTTAGGIGFYDCPGIMVIDVVAPGAHTWQLMVQLSNAFYTFQTPPGGAGTLIVHELA